jgi:hypothetical protein
MTEHPDYFYADEPSFVLRALRHLSGHPDPDVSRFATEALSNPYSPVVKSVGERLKSLGHPLGELYNWSGVGKGTYLDRDVLSTLRDRHLYGDESDPHAVVRDGIDEYFRSKKVGESTFRDYDVPDGESLSPMGHALASELGHHPDDVAKSLRRVQQHLVERDVTNDPRLEENHGRNAGKVLEREKESGATGKYHYSRSYSHQLSRRGER